MGIDKDDAIISDRTHVQYHASFLIEQSIVHSQCIVSQLQSAVTFDTELVNRKQKSEHTMKSERCDFLLCVSRNEKFCHRIRLY